MRHAHRLATIGLATALAACAVKLNGKSYGLGDHAAAAQPSSGGGAASIPNGTSADGAPVTDRERERQEALHRPPPAKPAAPWAGLDGDKPRSMPARRYDFFNPNPADCSGAHDHCLPEWTWLAEQGAKATELARSFSVYAYRGDAEHADEPWVALYGRAQLGDDAIMYRTVPATPRLLRKGALAIVLPYPAKAPASEQEAIEGYWRGGIVESFDLKSGKLRLVGHRDVYYLSATRLAVVRLAPGGKPENLTKLAPEQLVVAATEAIAPVVDVGGTSDPWAGVAKDGQPLGSDDRTPFEDEHSVTCDAAHDHCLRPWVWFVDDPLKPRPARWIDGRLQVVFAIDNYVPQSGNVMAYRTVPATPALAVGAKVFFRTSIPDQDADANTGAWMSGTVAEVQPEAGVFKIKGDDDYFKIAAARVAVVQWFPGEKAEKVAP